MTSHMFTIVSNELYASGCRRIGVELPSLIGEVSALKTLYDTTSAIGERVNQRALSVPHPQDCRNCKVGRRSVPAGLGRHTERRSREQPFAVHYSRRGLMHRPVTQASMTASNPFHVNTSSRTGSKLGGGTASTQPTVRPSRSTRPSAYTHWSSITHRSVFHALRYGPMGPRLNG